MNRRSNQQRALQNEVIPTIRNYLLEEPLLNNRDTYGFDQRQEYIQNPQQRNQPPIFIDNMNDQFEIINPLEQVLLYQKPQTQDSIDPSAFSVFNEAQINQIHRIIQDYLRVAFPRLNSKIQMCEQKINRYQEVITEYQQKIMKYEQIIEKLQQKIISIEQKIPKIDQTMYKKIQKYEYDISLSNQRIRRLQQRLVRSDQNLRRYKQNTQQYLLNSITNNLIQKQFTNLGYHRNQEYLNIIPTPQIMLNQTQMQCPISLINDPQNLVRWSQKFTKKSPKVNFTYTNLSTQLIKNN